MSATQTTLSKARTITCAWCHGTGRDVTADPISKPCSACSGYGKASAHSLRECWCDGTAEAADHDNH